MKRVFKSHEEPTGLAEYRSSNLNGTWQEFRDEAKTAYEDVVERLKSDQGGLCAYCEINVIRPQDQRVEHFHPKADSTNLRNWHLDWQNLWICCHGGEAYATDQAVLQGRTKQPTAENLSCDARKGKDVLDDRILNPGEIPAFPRIFKYRIGDGEMQIDEQACKEADIDSHKAQATIDLLGLNCQRLKDARAEIIRAIERVRKTARIHKNSGEIRTQTVEHLLNRFLTRNDSGIWHRFFTVARWSLGARAERYLSDCKFDG